MKKILLCISFLSSLYGADDLTLQMRASNLWSSVQTKWPLNTPLTIAACSALAAYAGYTACTSRGPSITVLESTQRNEELFNAGKPYLYAYACRKLALEKVLKLAASDSVVNSLVPADIKDKKAINASYATPCEDYLHQYLFTQKNRNLIEEESALFKQQGLGEKIKEEIGTVQEIKIDMEESQYNCILSEAAIKKVDPTVFFRSAEFLKHSLHDNLINVDFKTEDMLKHQGFALRLSFIKQSGFIHMVKIFDYRESIYADYTDKYKKDGASCSERSLTADELTAVNQNYIKELFVKAGGTLYKPQPKSALSPQPQKSPYAWYNPIRWLRVLLRLSLN